MHAGMQTSLSLLARNHTYAIIHRQTQTHQETWYLIVIGKEKSIGNLSEEKCRFRSILLNKQRLLRFCVPASAAKVPVAGDYGRNLTWTGGR